ncbi:GLPGLI family protein [Cloacibacterium normanense]|nr:GLPGLI family protein [Cloacibacterium normanense]AZI70376.1 GLPGLI family protein [Cloacibacterium normanense]SDO89265.1 GLPGLI family protein [Cloacibacterium normanense]
MKAILMLLFFWTGVLYSQNIKVIYMNKNSKFTTFQEDLFITKNNIVSIRDSITINTFDEKNSMNNNQAIFFTKDKLYKIFYYKNNPNKTIIKDYIGDTIYFVEDDIPVIKWSTNYNETKNIAGFLCNKATAEFRGSKITAFYTKDLKYNTGPFKFYGLDGLILEISENENLEYNSWVAIKVDTNYKNDYKIPEIKESIKIKLRDFLEIKEKKKEEDFDKIVSKAPAGTIITRHKIKRNEIEKIYEWE